MPKQTASKENVDLDLADFQVKAKKPGASKLGFAAPVAEAKIAEYSKGSVVLNTMKNTEWAVRAFSVWCKERNKRESNKCPEKLLESRPTV